MIKPELAKLIDTKRIRLYELYYDTMDKAVHLDINAVEINKLQNQDVLTIPLLMKTLATATQMMAEDYLTMMRLAVKQKEEKKIVIPRTN